MNTEATTPNRKRKLYAVLPDGTVATRTTARTYSHVVAVMVTPEEQLAYNVELIAAGGLHRRERLQRLRPA